MPERAPAPPPPVGTVFQPLRMRRAADEVIAVVVDALRGGAYGVGDALPRERDLAEQLGVSRPVVGQALDVLRRAGVVTSRRGVNGGTFVASLDNLHVLQRDLRGPMHDSIRSILETRRGLELTAGLLAGERAPDHAFARIDELVDLLEQMVTDGSHSAHEVWTVDIRFHRAVAEITGNSLLERLLDATLHDLTMMRGEFPYGHVKFDRAVRNQRKHAEALKRREPRRIARAVDDHLAALEEVYLGERLTFLPASLLPARSRRAQPSD